MLRVGLTGDLGSGKSTVAKTLAQRGAIVFSSDEMGRAMMQPGETVYERIVAHFGPSVVAADKSLHRAELARLAFDPVHPRVEELNAIVHPAVIAAQAERIAELEKTNPQAIVVIESALIFTTLHAGDGEPWRKRFDRIVLVTAPEEQKIERFVERASGGRALSSAEQNALEQDARKRLTLQQANQQHANECLIVQNDGTVAELDAKVEFLWETLQAIALNQASAEE